MSAIIDRLVERARARPHETALEDSHTSLSCSELMQRTSALAHVLRASGCKTLALMADNRIDWIVADLAALTAGITMVPIPPYFNPVQISHLLDSASVDTLLLEAGLEIAEALGERTSPMGVSFGSLTLYRRPGADPHGGADCSAAAKITFTSGSTSDPKGVCLSAECLDAVAQRLCEIFEGMRIRRHLCVTPLATLLENVAGVYVPLMLGTTVSVPSLSAVGLYGSSQLDIRSFRRTIDRYRPESLILQPQLLRELTASVAACGWRPTSLRFVAVGGARVSADDLSDAASEGIPAFQGYGLSECASVVALNRPGETRPASVGCPLPGIDVRIADDGEIFVRGQHMSGYVGERPFEGGYLATGDLGHMDDDGFLYVTGRKKNTFITSFGRNVSPEWPEAELLHQPEIAQACVFGEARPSNTAVIVPAPEHSGANDVANAVRRANRSLPDYARVSDWIVADQPFSVANGLLTPTGKARRDAISLRYLVGTDSVLPTATAATA